MQTTAQLVVTVHEYINKTHRTHDAIGSASNLKPWRTCSEKTASIPKSRRHPVGSNCALNGVSDFGTQLGIGRRVTLQSLGPRQCKIFM